MVSPPILQYAATSESRVSWQSLPEGGVQIVVCSVRRQARKRWNLALELVASGEWFGLILAPILIPTIWLVHYFFASNAPRAVLVLTSDTFSLTDRGDEGFGWFAKTRVWPRRSIGELRRNQFDPILFLRIPEKESFDLLMGLDVPTFDEVVELLTRAQQDCPCAPTVTSQSTGST